MEKTKIGVLVILSVLLAALIGACWIASQSHAPAEQPFTPPDFDPAAVTGVPENIPDQAATQILKLKEDLILHTATNARLHDGEADLYFVNDAGNTCNIMLVLKNEAGREIGRSGLIRPGNYLTSVPIGQSVKELTIQVLTYQPDTFYSYGTATLKLNTYQ